MNDANKKGSALEMAVQAIESAILRSFPAYSESTFRIENRKLIVVDDVRHEIDIWVSVTLGAGYDSVFIFECKNWDEKVGKNDIIVFAEKVRVSKAQKGYFVAKSFTRDALAQAELEPRMELLLVHDLPLDGVPVPFGFHGIHIEGTKAAVTVHLRREQPSAPREPIPIDTQTARLVIDGRQLDAHQFFDSWIADEANKRPNGFASGKAVEGIHELPFSSRREFSGDQATLNGAVVESIDVSGVVTVRVIHPKIVSHFEVESRGRAFAVDIDLPVGTVHTFFIARLTPLPSEL